MKSIERRVRQLEVVAHQCDKEALRLFIMVIGREPQGFVAHHPPGPAIARQDGETVEALEARCAAEAPGVTIWRCT